MAGEYILKVYTNHKVIGATDVTTELKEASFQFAVDNIDQANSHCEQILLYGYRRKVADGAIEWIPKHAIKYIRVEGPGIADAYHDIEI